MQEVIDFLRSTPAFFVATSGPDGTPHNRPFSLVFEYKGKVMFGTSSVKTIFHDLESNPKVEICNFNEKTGEWLRYHGSVEFLNERECREKEFETMPELLKIYGSPDNETMRNFYIKDGVADFYNFASPTPFKTIKL